MGCVVNAPDNQKRKIKMESNNNPKRAGRKLGSASKKTREIADKAAEQGITPLEVMINNMRYAYDLATTPGLDPDDVLKYREIAQESAKDAAPYMHPRLATVDIGNRDNKPFAIESKNTTDDELNARILELAAKIGEGGITSVIGGEAAEEYRH